MRVVLDTNTVVSGFLWDRQPRALIEAAIDERIELISCAALIEELANVLPAINSPNDSPRSNFPSPRSSNAIAP